MTDFDRSSIGTLLNSFRNGLRSWRYMKVLQTDFVKLQATDLGDVALILGI
jgi:hypothetical protein